MPEATDVRYLVLPDAIKPQMLARVRWPDVAQAISPGCPHWQEDIGLFDLPHDPISTPVTRVQAAAIALSWGANLPSDSTPRESGPLLIRRMPANWSNLAPAEKRAWSLESVPGWSGASRSGGADGRAPSGSRIGRWLSARTTPGRPSEPPPSGPEWGTPEPAVARPSYEDAWDQVVETVPAVVMNDGAGPVETGDRRLPTVFSKMREGSPPPVGDQRGQPSETSVFS